MAEMVTMGFNAQLRKELKKYEKNQNPRIETAASRNLAEDKRAEAKPTAHEKVVGGEIIWKPVDRQAALLIARAPWWAHPPQIKTEPEPIKPKPKKKDRVKMKAMESPHAIHGEEHVQNGSYISKSGLKVTMVNGQPMLNLDEIKQLIIDEIHQLPQETRPTVRAAEDARRIVNELLEGMGGDMEKFKASSKLYLEDIRQTRFAVVSETAAMTKELKEVRQFFLGSDYKEQTDRLREFVDLCERLQKLKACGFLDSVADTMLRLA